MSAVGADPGISSPTGSAGRVDTLLFVLAPPVDLLRRRERAPCQAHGLKPARRGLVDEAELAQSSHAAMERAKDKWVAFGLKSHFATSKLRRPRKSAGEHCRQEDAQFSACTEMRISAPYGSRG